MRGCFFTILLIGSNACNSTAESPLAVATPSPIWTVPPEVPPSRTITAGLTPNVTSTPKVTETKSTDTSLVQVQVGEFFFDPQVVTITMNSTIEWVPVGNHLHTIVSKSSTFYWRGTVGEKGGHKFRITFGEPGRYEYYCDVHSGVMEATIVVLTR